MTSDDEIRRLAEELRHQPRDRPSDAVRPGPGQESVWDYPRPPRVEPTSKAVRVEFGGAVIAETTRALRVLETSSPPVYYIPPDDVRRDLLVATNKRTLCEWKGWAVYWTLQLGERTVPHAAWSYPEPWPGYESIRDHLAFYAGKMDACTVAGERVTPQPGAFYGGWITSDIVGPFKGGAGTSGW